MPKSPSRRGASRRSAQPSGARPSSAKPAREVPAGDADGPEDPDAPGGDTGAVTGGGGAAGLGGRRGRAKDVAAARPPGQSSPWVPALMVTCFVVGLVWLVVYYLAGTQVPGMSALGNWNLLVGIGLIAVGFVVSTQWR